MDSANLLKTSHLPRNLNLNPRLPLEAVDSDDSFLGRRDQNLIFFGFVLSPSGQSHPHQSWDFAGFESPIRRGVSGEEIHGLREDVLEVPLQAPFFRSRPARRVDPEDDQLRLMQNREVEVDGRFAVKLSAGAADLVEFSVFELEDLDEVDKQEIFLARFGEKHEDVIIPNAETLGGGV